MDKIASKWLRALRSGKIKQGRGRLIDDQGRMCCLGVLGKVSGMTDDELRRHASSISGTGLEPIDAFMNLHTKLSPAQLADMNDGRESLKRKPKSFKQIANFIEKKL